MSTQWWRTPRARRTGLWLAGAGVIGIIVWFFFFHPYVSTDDARVAAHLYRIAPDTASGRIIKLDVSEGDAVKAGDTLVELDHTLARAELDKAQSKLALADSDFTRVKQLFNTRGVPRRDYDIAKNNLDMAQAEAAVAQNHFDNTYLKAPVDGVVVQKVAEVGNILDHGQTALTIADMGHAWIAANIEETSVGYVRPGQPVDVEVDTGGSLTGKVAEVRQATASQFSLIPSDSGSGNFTKVVQRIPIKVELDSHPGQTLRVGQSVEIRIRVR